ncbi:MAG TPA: SDR family NAD(P)-dependent oxidoreductase, partial [Emticicia sp.]
MNMLKNKKIVIIGGTTGLGLSAAKAFVKNGAKLVVVGRNPESCVAAEIELGENVHAMSGDAANPDTAMKAIDL